MKIAITKTSDAITHNWPFPDGINVPPCNAYQITSAFATAKIHFEPLSKSAQNTGHKSNGKASQSCDQDSSSPAILLDIWSFREMTSHNISHM